MDYSELSRYCQYGWTDSVKRILDQSKEKINIFWGEDELIHMAAIYGGADVLELLIRYYEEHDLKGMEPGSDEYLHARQLLIDAMQRTYDSTTRTLPEVMEIFLKYGIELEYDAASDNGLDDEPVPSFDSEDHEDIINTEVTVCKDSHVTEESGVSDHQSTDYHSDDASLSYRDASLGANFPLTGVPTDYVE